VKTAWGVLRYLVSSAWTTARETLFVAPPDNGYMEWQRQRDWLDKLQTPVPGPQPTIGVKVVTVDELFAECGMPRIYCGESHGEAA
jgi:hypothetical protein